MSLDHSPSEETDKKHYDFKVNGSSYSTRDRIRDGGAIRRQAGLTPPSDFVLIQLRRPGSTSLGLDEDIDLGERGAEEFRGFHSDRIFNFTVEEIAYEWGEAKISEADLRDIADVPHDKALILERGDEPDVLIEPGTFLELDGRGVEHVRIGKRLVTVYYGEQAFELERGVYTGAQLASKFGVPTGYILDLIRPGNEFDEISADERVKIREGMRFISHAPVGQSA